MKKRVHVLTASSHEAYRSLIYRLTLNNEVIATLNNSEMSVAIEEADDTADVVNFIKHGDEDRIAYSVVEIEETNHEEELNAANERADRYMQQLHMVQLDFEKMKQRVKAVSLLLNSSIEDK